MNKKKIQTIFFLTLVSSIFYVLSFQNRASAAPIMINIDQQKVQPEDQLLIIVSTTLNDSNITVNIEYKDYIIHSEFIQNLSATESYNFLYPIQGNAANGTYTIKAFNEEYETRKEFHVVRSDLETPSKYELMRFYIYTTDLYNHTFRDDVQVEIKNIFTSDIDNATIDKSDEFCELFVMAIQGQLIQVIAESGTHFANKTFFAQQNSTVFVILEQQKTLVYLIFASSSIAALIIFIVVVAVIINRRNKNCPPGRKL